MFKRQTINFHWPVKMSGFTKEANENFSRALLKVFYKGETEDHRLFSDAFAEELIKSLPYTPVVSHYDEEKQDFVGHASEQNVYGIVDPCVAPKFEKDDKGVEWCVCEVVLHTQRPDTTGKIAEKIAGHSQSLELDPRTVKYVINYDERKHFKNIEFTAGTFVGVSVLGDDQEPAFTGSAFFERNEQFQQKMEILRNYCEGNTDPKQGDEKMNFNEFVKLSWGDICSKVSNAVDQEYGNEYFTCLVDFYDDCGIYRFYSYIDGSIKLMKIYYSLAEDGEVTLNKIVETHVVYEDLEDEQQTGTFAAKDGSEEENFATDSSEENFAAQDLTATDANATVTLEEVEVTANSAEVAPISKASAENEGQTTEEETSGAASLTDSERAELENLKREKKLNLISEYAEYLTEEEQNSFTSNIDNYTEETLEIELLKVYKKHQEEEITQHMVPFAVPEPQKKETAESNVNSYIRRMLRK